MITKKVSAKGGSAFGGKNLENLPQEVLNLIYKIGRFCDTKKINGYLVGGFIRDLYLGLPNFDLDVVVEANAIEFAENFLKELGSHLICHHRFGTATISSFEKHKIDIATARKEIYESPASLPKVTPSTLFEDLKRRDFTINTLAFSINKKNFGETIDYFQGLKDLREKKIRVLHDLSFIDDPTRILRAVRFETRFNFKIEPKTLSLLKRWLGISMLDKVQKQRIRDEIILLLKEKDPIACIGRMDYLAGFSFIHPKIKPDYKLLAGLARQINWFNITFPKKRALDSWLLYFIVLVDKISLDDTNHILRNFCFRRGETKRIRDYKTHLDTLIKKLSQKNLSPSKIYRILEPLPYELILMLKLKCKLKIVNRHILDFFNIYNGERLSVSGKDIASLGLKPGPYFKDILKKTLYAKLDGKLLSNLDELEYLKSCVKKYLKG